MKLTEVDRLIIETLNINKEGITERSICSYLKIDNNSRGMVNKRLNRLFKYGVINRIGGYPKMYYIDAITDIRKLNIVRIQCRKCKQVDIIFDGQQTKLCSRCKHRYWISEKRIKGYYKDTTS